MDDTEVLVPCLNVGLGTLTAVIRDARNGRRVRLEGVEMLSWSAAPCAWHCLS